MVRAFFFAIGVFSVLLGLECLAVDEVLLRPRSAPPTNGPLPDTMPQINGLPPGSQRLAPPDWAPWSLMSAGAVTVLYALTIKRNGGAPLGH